MVFSVRKPKEARALQNNNMIYKIKICDDCQQYKEDCVCCQVCGNTEGHDGKSCSALAYADTVPPPAPKRSYIKTLIGVGAKTVNQK